MSIADKLSRLSDARDDIITALAGKDVTATGHGFEDFPDDIDSIQQGGGGEQTIAENTYSFSNPDDDGTKLVSDIFATNAAIVLGNTYTVTFNNVEYTCVAGTSSSGNVGVGSLNYTFTDFPFFITSYQSGSTYQGWWAVQRGNTGSKSIKVVQQVQQPGIGTLLATLSLGTISTSSTNAADTGKSISVSGINNYDLLIVETSVNNVTNSRHTATVGLIFLTAGTSVGTKNGATVLSNKWNSKISSSGVTTTRQGTTAYGIYPNSCTINSGTATIPLYQRYNSTSTGTINNAYTARVYGVKLYDLIGG